MSGKSTLIISHRVSSVKLCDEILVFEDGQIIERGSHEELMQLKGDYFEIHEQQQLETLKAD